MPRCKQGKSPIFRDPRLTLIRTPEPITGQGSRGQWSLLMARAQDGDREAYRTLLTEVEPYVRSIAIAQQSLRMLRGPGASALIVPAFAYGDSFGCLLPPSHLQFSVS
jgi:hypothetical protein